MHFKVYVHTTLKIHMTTFYRIILLTLTHNKDISTSKH